MTDVVASSVPIVRYRLYQLLKERLAVQVLYGPEVAEIAHENVIVGGLLNTGQQQVVVIGAQSDDEQYLLAVHITAGKPGQSPHAAYERAFGLLAEVKTVLLDDTSLGLNLYVQTRLGQFSEEESQIPNEGARCDIVAGVQVNARLRGR